MCAGAAVAQDLLEKSHRQALCVHHPKRRAARGPWSFWTECGCCARTSPSINLRRPNWPVRARTHIAMRLFIASCILVQIVALHTALARLSITGQAVNNIGDIGEHYPLFVIKKSHHP